MRHTRTLLPLHPHFSLHPDIQQSSLFKCPLQTLLSCHTDFARVIPSFQIMFSSLSSLPIKFYSFLKFQLNHYVFSEVFPDHLFFSALRKPSSFPSWKLLLITYQWLIHIHQLLLLVYPPKILNIIKALSTSFLFLALTQSLAEFWPHSRSSIYIYHVNKERCFMKKKLMIGLLWPNDIFKFYAVVCECVLRERNRWFLLNLHQCF